MKIPFVDLNAQYQSIKAEIDLAMQNVMADCAFVGTANNKYLQSFEKAFASYNNASYCIGCANGSDSIELILKALEIGMGDEVLVPALSWIATSEAVSNMGGKPVFVDIEPTYYCIDPAKIEEKITEKTKAIIAVHLYGHPADMEAILSIAKKHGLFVIEDCAQAHGAEINGKKVGTFGIAGSFSFFPSKNLGAYGDAGCILTSNEELAKKCRMLSQHGQLERKHHHYIEGRNSRMDGIQAAILSVKLKYLPEWTEQRRRHALSYIELLNSKVKTPQTKENFKHVYHLFVLESDMRERISDNLKRENIDTAIQYPTPLPFLEAYRNRNYKEQDFPVASSVTKRIISIPLYPELSKEQIEKMSAVILTSIKLA